MMAAHGARTAGSVIICAEAGGQCPRALRAGVKRFDEKFFNTAKKFVRNFLRRYAHACDAGGQERPL